MEIIPKSDNSQGSVARFELHIQQRGCAFGDGFAGVFRCDDRRREMRIHAGFSEDGVEWRIDPQPIEFICDDREIGSLVYAY